VIQESAAEFVQRSAAPEKRTGLMVTTSATMYKRLEYVGLRNLASSHRLGGCWRAALISVELGFPARHFADKN
jgi:hypothetical protein